MKTIPCISVLCLIALSACSGVKTFDQQLRQLEGRPVNDADLMLGQHATGEYMDGPAKVYVWQDHNVESIFGPAVTSRGGYQLGSRVSNGDALIWSGIQFDSCTIRATTLDGIIKRVTFEGNPGGCESIYGHRKRELGYDISQRP